MCEASVSYEWTHLKISTVGLDDRAASCISCSIVKIEKYHSEWSSHLCILHCFCIKKENPFVSHGLSVIL